MGTVPYNPDLKKKTLLEKKGKIKVKKTYYALGLN